MKEKIIRRKMTAIGFIAVFALAFLRVHLRVETTLVGYDIGKLKSREAKALMERGRLNMQLAQITTRQSLAALSSDTQPKTNSSGRLAAR